MELETLPATVELKTVGLEAVELSTVGAEKLPETVVLGTVELATVGLETLPATVGLETVVAPWPAILAKGERLSSALGAGLS